MYAVHSRGAAAASRYGRAYLALRQDAAPKMALATFLCIISPVPLLLLAAMSEVSRFGISENAAAGIGLCALLVLAAIGVTLFLTCAAKVRDFAFLEETPFETEYGVSGMAKERRQSFSAAYNRLNIAGTVLCILSAVPLFIAICTETANIVYVAAICMLLAIAGVGCIFLSTAVPSTPPWSVCWRKASIPASRKLAAVSRAQSAPYTG